MKREKRHGDEEREGGGGEGAEGERVRKKERERKSVRQTDIYSESRNKRNSTCN